MGNAESQIGDKERKNFPYCCSSLPEKTGIGENPNHNMVNKIS